jgi:hypothetical protein
MPSRERIKVVNYFKQQQRRFDVAKAYEKHLGGPTGSPLFVRTLATPAKPHDAGVINLPPANTPSVRRIKSGARIVKRLTFK